MKEMIQVKYSGRPPRFVGSKINKNQRMSSSVFRLQEQKSFTARLQNKTNRCSRKTQIIWITSNWIV